MDHLISYKEYDIRIIQDESPMAPNEWDNNELFLVYDHRSLTVKVEGFSPDDIFEALGETKGKYGEYWVFPVYAYIHSGVALSLGRNKYPFNDPWDVSFKGFALVKQVKGWSWRLSTARKIAESLIETWNIYLSGEVYGYKIYQGNEEIESCWGYYGLNETIKEAKVVIEMLNSKAA